MSAYDRLQTPEAKEFLREMAMYPTLVKRLLREAGILNEHGELTDPYRANIWRCYHCGFTATNDAEAKAHFGDTMTNDPTSCLLYKLEVQEGVIRDLLAKLNDSRGAGNQP